MIAEPNILYSKEGFIFTKKDKNNYQLTFQMNNNNIILPKIIDFNLVKLIYDLNGDIYENINLQIINDEEAVINMLMKHLFQDIGMPQRYSYLHIKKYVTENKIIFISQTIKSERPEGIPESAEPMHIQNLTCECYIIDNHHIEFSCNLVFDNIVNIPQVAEKIVGVILFKIFKRVKLFIDNIRI